MVKSDDHLKAVSTFIWKNSVNGIQICPQAYESERIKEFHRIGMKLYGIGVTNTMCTVLDDSTVIVIGYSMTNKSLSQVLNSKLSRYFGLCFRDLMEVMRFLI